MLTALGAFGASLLPIVLTILLLEVAARWHRLREQAVLRQIALTDAIGERFGAIVAPVVERPVFALWASRRPWRIRIAVPFARPGTVAGLLAVAHDFGQRTMSSGYEIVLTAQDERPRRETTPRMARALVPARDVKAA